MKRILVADDSDAVRETIALLLESDFSVVKRNVGPAGLSLADVETDIELVIIGVASGAVPRAARLLNLAARRKIALLFLLETKSLVNSIAVQENVGCLVKPFNPYHLKAEVGRLLAQSSLSPPVRSRVPEPQRFGSTRYLEFPYVSRLAASLARRFATIQIPVLISGEIGCGQERVARAMHSLSEHAGPQLVLTPSEITEEYLARRRSDLAARREPEDLPITVLLEEIDKLSPTAQSLLRAFIEEELDHLGQVRLFSTSKSDLLQRVYAGEFLELLYAKLAVLNLALPPLRQRSEDIPAIARWFAEHYGKELGLGEISFTPAANERLRSYLWFGNVNEMETVIARTLAVHRKNRIEESDLIFDFNAQALEPPKIDEPAASTMTDHSQTFSDRAISHAASNGFSSQSTADKVPDLRLLIHELAHELKNPMVTIKTFAQLLSDRYQDESFRARFQEVVDGDIERIDDVLEMMIEFADFSQPRGITIPLEEQLQSTLNEIAEERTDKQVRTGWNTNASSVKIVADEAQLKYVLKNALLAVLTQAKAGSEIDIGLEKPGRLTISYTREGGRVASISHFFNTVPAGGDETVLPLRMLLVRHLLERNGGSIKMNPAEGDRESLEMEFPVA